MNGTCIKHCTKVYTIQNIRIAQSTRSANVYDTSVVYTGHAMHLVHMKGRDQVEQLLQTTPWPYPSVLVYPQPVSPPSVNSQLHNSPINCLYTCCYYVCRCRLPPPPQPHHYPIVFDRSSLHVYYDPHSVHRVNHSIHCAC